MCIAPMTSALRVMPSTPLKSAQLGHPCLADAKIAGGYSCARPRPSIRGDNSAALRTPPNSIQILQQGSPAVGSRSRPHRPTSLLHIVDVVLLRAFNEMLGIKARRVVATVADHQPGRGFTISKRVARPGDEDILSYPGAHGSPSPIAVDAGHRPRPALFAGHACAELLYPGNEMGGHIGSRQRCAGYRLGGFTGRAKALILALGHRSSLAIGGKSAPGASNTRRRRVHLSGVQPASNHLPTGGRNGS